MNLEEVRFSKSSNLEVLSQGNFHPENRHKSKHIVFYDIPFCEIFLATFSPKAETQSIDLS